MRVHRPFNPGQRFAKLLVSRRIVGIATDIFDTIEQPSYDLIVDLADSKMAQSAFQVGAECLLGLVASRYSYDCEGFRQEAPRLQIVERGH